MGLSSEVDIEYELMQAISREVGRDLDQSLMDWLNKHTHGTPFGPTRPPSVYPEFGCDRRALMGPTPPLAGVREAIEKEVAAIPGVRGVQVTGIMLDEPTLVVDMSVAVQPQPPGFVTIPMPKLQVPTFLEFDSDRHRRGLSTRPC